MASGHEQMAAMLAQQTLAVAQQTEKKLDAELRQLSQLDENDLEGYAHWTMESRTGGSGGTAVRFCIVIEPCWPLL